MEGGPLLAIRQPPGFILPVLGKNARLWCALSREGLKFPTDKKSQALKDGVPDILGNLQTCACLTEGAVNP